MIVSFGSIDDQRILQSDWTRTHFSHEVYAIHDKKTSLFPQNSLNLSFWISYVSKRPPDQPNLPLVATERINRACCWPYRQFYGTFFFFFFFFFWGTRFKNRFSKPAQSWNYVLLPLIVEISRTGWLLTVNLTVKWRPHKKTNFLTLPPPPPSTKVNNGFIV